MTTVKEVLLTPDEIENLLNNEDDFNEFLEEIDKI